MTTLETFKLDAQVKAEGVRYLIEAYKAERKGMQAISKLDKQARKQSKQLERTQRKRNAQAWSLERKQERAYQAYLATFKA